MAKSGPDAVAQARGGWASAVSMATHHARQHQVIPWERLASSPLGSTLGPGVIASSSSSVLPRASLHSTFSISLGVRKTGIFAGWCKSFGARGEAEFSPVAREAAAPLPGSLRLGVSICEGVRLQHWREREAPRPSYLFTFTRVGSKYSFLGPIKPNAQNP